MAGRQRMEVLQGAFLPGGLGPGPGRTVQGHGWGIPVEASAGLFRRPSIGTPLSRETRSQMEKLFGADFSDVRIHQGSEAAAIGAMAFTRGSDVYFAPGRYAPHTPQGRGLLAHELTHVLQQRAGRVPNPPATAARGFGGVAVVQHPALEAEAERMSARAQRPVETPRLRPASRLVGFAEPAFPGGPPAPAGQARRAMGAPVAAHVAAGIALGAARTVQPSSAPPGSLAPLAASAVLPRPAAPPQAVKVRAATAQGAQVLPGGGRGEPPAAARPCCQVCARGHVRSGSPAHVAVPPASQRVSAGPEPTRSKPSPPTPAPLAAPGRPLIASPTAGSSTPRPGLAQAVASPGARALQGSSPASVRRGGVLQKEDCPGGNWNPQGPRVVKMIPVRFEAVPLLGPPQMLTAGFGGDLGDSSFAGRTLSNAGVSSHLFAMGELSWLAGKSTGWAGRVQGAKGVFSPEVWKALLPRPPKGQVIIDRLTNTVPRNLDPRILREGPGQWASKTFEMWDDFNYGKSPGGKSIEVRFSEQQLRSIPELVRKFNAGTITQAELATLRQAARLHISGASAGAPFASYTVPDYAVRVGAAYRYRVRVQLDRASVLDVSYPNPFNQHGAFSELTNVNEMELLATVDQKGRRILSVDNIEPQDLLGKGAEHLDEAKMKPSSLMRHSNKLRWGGRILVVAGFGVSAYRISNASVQDRQRVIGEEVGGQLLGLLGGPAGAALCILLGVATGGWALFLCGLAGGLVFGTAGSFIGGGLADLLATPGHRRVGYSWQMDSAVSQMIRAEQEARQRRRRETEAAYLRRRLLSADERRRRMAERREFIAKLPAFYRPGEAELQRFADRDVAVEEWYLFYFEGRGRMQIVGHR